MNKNYLGRFFFDTITLKHRCVTSDAGLHQRWPPKSQKSVNLVEVGPNYSQIILNIARRAGDNLERLRGEKNLRSYSIALGRPNLIYSQQYDPWCPSPCTQLITGTGGELSLAEYLQIEVTTLWIKETAIQRGILNLIRLVHSLTPLVPSVYWFPYNLVLVSSCN